MRLSISSRWSSRLLESAAAHSRLARLDEQRPMRTAEALHSFIVMLRSMLLGIRAPRKLWSLAVATARWTT